MNETVRRLVWRRAEERCEYCRIRQQDDDLQFHVDHIVAVKHGGDDEAANLALACSHSNFRKGPNLAGIDPVTGAVTRLFHPRHETWSEHFAFAGAEIVGRTATGRATARVLDFNHVLRLGLRRALLRFVRLD